MDRRRLETLLACFANIHILVVGDFFLDEYLFLNRTLSETSLETGLEAYQVVEVRSSPGPLEPSAQICALWVSGPRPWVSLARMAEALNCGRDWPLGALKWTPCYQNLVCSHPRTPSL